ncbi:uncharacterized protein LOC128724948 [Anopheles nili]|uniref:uncharacterized protein LOC128724948 n=1 Tax=Anopheles nili TaxID=185578 RepID=UPI00237B6DDB|nr:uncharacterized protein LOC128724948 [Anopheles nili]
MERQQSVRGAARATDDQQQSTLFTELRAEIAKIDANAETITQAYQVRKFDELFRRRVRSELLINDLFQYFNEEALSDETFAQQLAIVFATRQLGDARLQTTNLRNTWIEILEKNFLGAKALKQQNVQRFYNSVTLLGNYYNRKMVALGSRIAILGESLMSLLNSELEAEIDKACHNPGHRIDPDFTKLLLSQITLNGAIGKVDMPKETNTLLFTMRKALIVVPNLCMQAKAFLLMAIDMYYGTLDENLLDQLYTKYIVKPAEPAHPVVVVGAETCEPVQTVQALPREEPSVINGGKHTPENEACDTKTRRRGGRSNRAGGGGGKGKSPVRTTSDKENKRRPVQPKVALGRKSTAPEFDDRNIRAQEDTNRVGSIKRETPTTPTKTNPPTPSQPRSPAKKGLSPRMEKLAVPPKITVTCSTPSPKRTNQEKSSPTSPRAVLGPSIARQKQQIPPNSPTPSREGRQTGKNGPSQVSRGHQSTTSLGMESGRSVNIPRLETLSLNDSSRGRDVVQMPAKPATSICPKTPATEPDRAAGTSTLRTTVREPNGHSKGHESVPAEKHKQTQVYFQDDHLDFPSFVAMLSGEGDSPKKANPYTKSFLSFLTSK